ncbi:hypothetical protein [Caldisphaera lagunensis]|uniref:hypothetical protein n=1 Tax=Caldisphaera lagunensis TaxID=200415 RepID=UPI00155A7A79|nr:hypothetical protein [Caldisphaera lagunensis]
MDDKHINEKDTISLICYPNSNKCDTYYRLNQIDTLGIEKLCNYGNIMINGNKYRNFHILGKGHSSIVLLGYVKKIGLKVIKIRRVDSKRSELINEGKILEKLSKYGISPKVYGYSRDFLIMDYVGEINLGYVLNNENKSNIINSLIESLKSIKLLDYTNIIHNELNRPWKNIYFPNYPNYFPALIIDFESYSEGCGNLNKFIGGIIGKLNITRFSKNLLELLAEYKNKNCDPLFFDKIIKELLFIINTCFIR